LHLQTLLQYTLFTHIIYILYNSSITLEFFNSFLSFCRSKRAAYKYAKDRGAVASRWCWLATQISELDFKIRQFTDLRKHIKENKGAVVLEEIAGFEGQLPGSNKTKTSFNANDDSEMSDDGLSARVRPLLKTSFRKRKLVQTANLHFSSNKAARPRFVIITLSQIFKLN
jgi:hypothetical protein